VRIECVFSSIPTLPFIPLHLNPRTMRLSSQWSA
jgi:hypothetical protein